MVLNQLLQESVLSIEGRMYILDPDRLANVLGLNFHDVHTGRTTPQTIEFLNRALAKNS